VPLPLASLQTHEDHFFADIIPEAAPEGHLLEAVCRQAQPPTNAQLRRKPSHEKALLPKSITSA
jgi:hypothetical protein